MQLLRTQAAQRTGCLCSRHVAVPRGPCVSRRRSVPVERRALGDSDEQSAEDRLAEVDAMREAAELYAEAHKISQQQVLQELMQMELADVQTYHDIATPSSDEPASPAASASSRAASSRSSSSAPGATRREPAFPAASLGALVGFWLEQGLSQGVAERVARELLASGSRYANTDLLGVQLQRLSRVIPSRVQDMVVRDLHILEASPATVAAHYVALVQLFPSSLDVTELAVRHPKLLYCDDLHAMYEAVLQKLVQLHPSHSALEAQALLIEYPELIFRIPQYYMHVRTLDELPIEIQNNIIHTGQGLAQLHQMYNKGVSPRFL